MGRCWIARPSSQQGGHFFFFFFLLRPLPVPPCWGQEAKEPPCALRPCYPPNKPTSPSGKQEDCQARRVPCLCSQEKQKCYHMLWLCAALLFTSVTTDHILHGKRDHCERCCGAKISIGKCQDWLFEKYLSSYSEPLALQQLFISMAPLLLSPTYIITQ